VPVRQHIPTPTNDEESTSYERFAERHNIRAAPYLTVADFETAAMIADRLAPRIQGKVVVEIGGGIGMLSIAMGAIAKRVYCIEANPLWSMTFAQFLLHKKPRNVSFLCGAADEFIGCIRGDVAVICTHSDVQGMKLVGAQFAKTVIDVYGEMMDENPEGFDPWARSVRPFV
jgi:predicted RNA methylase